MATFQTAPDVPTILTSQLHEARARTDAIFRLLPPNSFYERPVPERHRLIFYLGHVEAFDWNLLSGPLDLKSDEPEFDKLFAFGIDPVGGGLPTDVPADWPEITAVERYGCRIREKLDQKLGDPRWFRSKDAAMAESVLLHVAVEHRLMHSETLAYLLHNLPLEKVVSPVANAATSHFAHPPHAIPRRALIPAGVATLGKPRDAVQSFGWDNEFDEQHVFVPGFSMDAFPVTNGEYLKFIQAGGYLNANYWKPEDWEWRRDTKLEHPRFWRARSSTPSTDPDTDWRYRAMFTEIPLPHDWPVYVSHAEASAYSKWVGRKLPTEAQWHRAAYGTPEGKERKYPWGDQEPAAARGNFHHRLWDATPVNAHPAGASAFDVFDLLGNGWEWTSSAFAGLPGFKPFSFYPGYSANFFDGKHFVMKGGSPRTDACMLRRSFRNWFQPHYPYVYATFRCVED